MSIRLSTIPGKVTQWGAVVPAAEQPAASEEVNDTEETEEVAEAKASVL